MAKSRVLGQERGVGTEELSYEADEQFEHALRLRTPVALATKRKPLYNHEYGVFGRDNRHENQEVAKTLSEFLQKTTLGQFEIVCSSRAETGIPPGSHLKPALATKLADARALALIYTTAREDWSYCMWECGLVSHPKTPPTRIIVFQFTEDVPKVFEVLRRVDVQDPEAVKSFVITLLTDPNFFPEHGEKLSNFTNKSPEIGQIAKDLAKKLLDAAPPPESGPEDEWPSFDSLSIELPGATIQRITGNAPSSADQAKLVLTEAKVVHMDTYCPQLFGLPKKVSGISLEKLFDAWRSINGKLGDAWTAELVRQIIEAAYWRFPKIRWVLMGSRDRVDQYVPGVHHVKRNPGDGSIQFDIYFLPILNADVKAGAPDAQTDAS